MTESVAEILMRVEGLTPPERAELAYAIVCSLDPGEDEGVAEAWDEELSRRVAEIRRGKSPGKPAEQLFSELRDARP